MTTSDSSGRRSSRLKFLIGGALFLVAVIFMVISATQATAEFFLTVGELQQASQDYVGENLRVSGAVLGETIAYDVDTGLLHFTIAHIPGDEDEIEAAGGLSVVLHQAVIDQNNSRLAVIYDGAQPDMLRDEAQAIVTGSLTPDGVFLAEELLLKCPTKYEEAVPGQVE